MQTKAAMSLLAKQQRRQRRVISSYIKTHFPESSAAAELRLRELLPDNKFLNVLCENTSDGLLPVMYNVLCGCRDSEEMEQKLRAAIRTEDIGYADAEFIPQLIAAGRMCKLYGYAHRLEDREFQSELNAFIYPVRVDAYLQQGLFGRR